MEQSRGEAITKELLHCLFKDEHQFKCSKKEALELVEIFRDVSLQFQQFPLTVLDSVFVPVVVRELRRKFPGNEQKIIQAKIKLLLEKL